MTSMRYQLIAGVDGDDDGEYLGCLYYKDHDEYTWDPKYSAVER